MLSARSIEDTKGNAEMEERDSWFSSCPKEMSYKDEYQSIAVRVSGREN